MGSQGKQKSLKKNFIMNVILTMSSFLFPLITFPYVSRILLPAGTGRVSFVTSIVSYFIMFAQLGIPTYGIRVCAQVRDDREALSRTAHELLFINIATTAISMVVFLGCVLWVPRLQEERLLCLITSVSILVNAVGMEWMYKALEQYSYITIRSILFKFVALIAMFLLVKEQSDYVIYGGISIFASSASYLLNFANAHRFIELRYLGGYQVGRHIKAVGVFFALACAATVYTNLDTVMLGFMTTDTDVGYYNAAVKIKTILVSVVTSLGAVLLPRVSYYVEHGMTEEFHRVSKKALNFVLLLAAPLTMYFMLYAKEGIYFLSGDAYAGSILPMQIIMPTLLFIGITNILGIQILVPLGKEKLVLYAEIAGVIVDLILNALLIPVMASAGAAIGTLAAEFVVLLVQFGAVDRETKQLFFRIRYGAILIGLALAGAASWWVKSMAWEAFPTLVVSASLFFGVYGLFLLLTKEPLVTEIVGQLWRACKKGRN